MRLLLCLTALLAAAPVAAAQTQSVTYTLDNVWLDPDIQGYWNPPAQMTGSFIWTYTPGDFENGTATWLSIDIPWAHPLLNELAITVDVDQIETSLLGNYHNYAADVQLFLATPLSPGQPSTVDLVRSGFTIENGPTYQGHAISGSIVPDTALDLLVSGNCPSLSMSIQRATPLGQVALLHANGVGNMVVPNGLPCAGTRLGLDNSTALGTLLTADAAGTASISANLPAGACGTAFLQALDLSSCGTSQVVALL